MTWRSGVPHSFTLEATFCGSNLGPREYGMELHVLLNTHLVSGGSLVSATCCVWVRTLVKLSTSSANVFKTRREPPIAGSMIHDVGVQRYQLKVMAQLAEKLMERLATPTDHTHCPASTLPDVVTSTTAALPRSFSSRTHTSVHQQKKEARQSLRKFKGLDMSQLELESR